MVFLRSVVSGFHYYISIGLFFNRGREKGGNGIFPYRIGPARYAHGGAQAGSKKFFVK
jgi:hypothetical protein